MTETVTFATPIPYGEETLSEISLRKPTAGDLRGLKLMSVLELETNSLLTLVPRLATPAVTSGQLQALSPGDLIKMAGVIGGFFED
ncbi:MAG: phage tail assembly protein [Rhodospirillaceae bacterium]